jgi:hypothetical protein
VHVSVTRIMILRLRSASEIEPQVVDLTLTLTLTLARRPRRGAPKGQWETQGPGETLGPGVPEPVAPRPRLPVTKQLRGPPLAKTARLRRTRSLRRAQPDSGPPSRSGHGGRRPAHPSPKAAAGASGSLMIPSLSRGLRVSYRDLRLQAASAWVP